MPRPKKKKPVVGKIAPPTTNKKIKPKRKLVAAKKKTTFELPRPKRHGKQRTSVKKKKEKREEEKDEEDVDGCIPPKRLNIKDGKERRKCPHGYKLAECGCKPTLANVLPFEKITVKSLTPKPSKDLPPIPKEQIQARVKFLNADLKNKIAQAQKIEITPEEEAFLETAVPDLVEGLAKDKQAVAKLVQATNEEQDRKEANNPGWIRKGITYVKKGFHYAKKAAIYVLNKLVDVVKWIWNNPHVAFVLSLIALFIKRYYCKWFGDNGNAILLNVQEGVLMSTLTTIAGTVGAITRHIPDIFKVPGNLLQLFAEYGNSLLSYGYESVILSTVWRVIFGSQDLWFTSLLGFTYNLGKILSEGCFKGDFIFNYVPLGTEGAITEKEAKLLNFEKLKEDAAAHGKEGDLQFIKKRVEGKILNQDLSEHAKSKFIKNAAFSRALKNQLIKNKTEIDHLQHQFTKIDKHARPNEWAHVEIQLAKAKIQQADWIQSLADSRSYERPQSLIHKTTPRRYIPHAEYKADFAQHVRNEHANSTASVLLDENKVMSYTSKELSDVVGRTESIPWEERTRSESRAIAAAELELLARRGRQIQNMSYWESYKQFWGPSW